MSLKVSSSVSSAIILVRPPLHISGKILIILKQDLFCYAFFSLLVSCGSNNAVRQASPILSGL